MIDSQVLSLLAELGIGVAGNAVYDVIKRYFSSNRTPTVEGLREAIANSLALNGVTVNAATVVQFLANRGVITISNSNIHGPSGVALASNHGAFEFGNNSISQTDRTKIVASGRAAIVGTGTSAVVQNPDGSISFHVGGGGDIRFFT